MKIIFMGTPDFAVPILEALLRSEHTLVGVYSAPPKLSGRGLNMIKSPVHIVAEKCSIPVFTPPSLRNSTAIEQFQALGADIAVVAAYGLILPSGILNASKYGCINVHPSDLPRWRGAAPIQRSIMAGDNESALCIMKMDEGLDTGDVTLKQKVIITDNMTTAELSDRMSLLGGDMILKALHLIAEDCAEYVKQHDNGVTYADKITKEEEKINWNHSAYMLNCQIRALSPKPGAHFIHNTEVIKIISATYTDEESTFPPGMVIDQNLGIACKNGILRPILLQRQGRKMIYLDAFLRGYKIAKGDILQ